MSGTEKIGKRSIKAIEAENVMLHGRTIALQTTIEVLLAREEERTAREAEARRRLEELELLVTKDPLTGLLNRRGFKEAMERHLSDVARVAEHGGTPPQPATLVYIDLDVFKPINDLFSHKVGDIILMKLGSALRRILWKSDYVARIGGDEFAILLKRVENRQKAEKVVEKIRKTVEKITIDNANQEQLEQLYKHAGRRHVLGFSAGYFVIENAELSVEQMLDLAEHDVPKFAALRPTRGQYSK